MRTENSFSTNRTAKILLEDGTLIEGNSFGANKTVFAEIVFNTGMTGYQEILTDPSYASQVVVMTYPLIGNYGINKDDVQSDRVKASGIVVKEYCLKQSNWKSEKNISEYLKEHNILGVSGVDTRMLAKKIRSKGTMKCLITTEDLTTELANKLKQFTFPEDIVSRVSRSRPEIIPGVNKKIALLDYGVKTGIVDYLSLSGTEITLLPWNTSYEEILVGGYDAVLLSNGPGDPKDVVVAKELVDKLISKLPLFGICLGHQILALALGADTYKMKFGHRGSNHPVICLDSGKVVVTAQNHGYAVLKNNLPERVKVTHLNVNDESIEGFCCPDFNIHAVQFHPEAGPGPRDANYLFKEWLNLL